MKQNKNMAIRTESKIALNTKAKRALFSADVQTAALIYVILTVR